jgi:hypothetical protein
MTEAYEKEMRVYGSEAVKTSDGIAHGNMGITTDKNSKTV